MDMYPKYKSPFGYETGDNGIDSYGVNHSGFSLRDEIEYQTARDQRESQLMQMYNQQGITDNYPQYTTNFWVMPVIITVSAVLISVRQSVLIRQ